jgi:carbonic anhydrase/acetyltransferase-like protein (isoleucine patch superfamily)
MAQNYKKKTVVRQVANRVLHVLARILPGATTLRPALHRLRGVKVGKGVFIGDDVYLENEYPEAVEVGDGTQIALRSVIVAHLRGPGRVVIGKDVWIGACAFISSATGRTLTIGDGAVIGACSVITADVSARAVVRPPQPERVGTAHVPLATAQSYRQFLLGLRPYRSAEGARDKDALDSPAGESAEDRKSISKESSKNGAV